MKNRKQIWYIISSIFFAGVLFIYATTTNYQNNSNARQTTSETYTNTLPSVPIDIKYNSEKYFISGFASEVSVVLTGSNRVTLASEMQESTRKFKVVADLTKATEGTREVPLAIKNLPSGLTATVTPAKITVKVGKKASKTVEVKTTISSAQLADGLMVDRVTIGYLTLTLPVNEHQIILSKLLGAVIWTILSTLALFLSFGIIVLIVGVASHTQFEMGTVLQLFGKHFWEIASELLKSFGYYLVALIPNILLIYLSISIGQLFQDHRAAIAFLAYFGIQFALIIAANLYVSAFPSLSTSLGSLSGVITSLLLGLIYYTGTYYILKNKVNLQ